MGTLQIIYFSTILNIVELQNDEAGELKVAKTYFAGFLNTPMEDPNVIKSEAAEDHDAVDSNNKDSVMVIKMSITYRG